MGHTDCNVMDVPFGKISDTFIPLEEVLCQRKMPLTYHRWKNRLIAIKGFCTHSVGTLEDCR